MIYSYIYNNVNQHSQKGTAMTKTNIPSSPFKNPSRETCENIIRKILMTEVLQQGKNNHFKHASDFMGYFESLYPASSGLTKQVQRAVRSLNFPKDENGYFIVNKTSKQLKQEAELKSAFQMASVSPLVLTEYTPVFLSAKPSLCPYLKELIQNAITFQEKILTIAETSNGLLLYTNQPKELEKLCHSLLKD